MDEGRHDRLALVCGELFQMIRIEQEVQVHRRIAVIHRAVELQRADHTGSGVVALRLAVIHGGKEVEIVLGFVRGERVGKHGCAFEGERWHGSRHASE